MPVQGIKTNEDKPMKYRVTTTLLSSHDRGDQISEGVRRNLTIAGCPESWFEEVQEFEEGEWIIGGRGALIKYKEDTSDGTCGWDLNGNWGDQWYNHYGGIEDIDNYRKATTEEVKEALIEEAKRRGYHNAKKWKPLWGKARYWIPRKSRPCFKYDYREDVLFYGNVGVYQEGNWAEIIEDEWEYLPVGHEIANTRKSMQLPEWVNDRQAEAIATALNELDNESQ